jgi:hypothetical protein
MLGVATSKWLLQRRKLYDVTEGELFLLWVVWCVETKLSLIDGRKLSWG